MNMSLLFENVRLKAVITALLVALMFLPSAFELTHHLDGHEHISCDEISVHLHEKKLDCSLCDFQISSFDYIPLEFDLATVGRIIGTTPVHRQENITNNSCCLPSLRGPPVFV